MKLSNLKHNHSLTDLLKILIFAILMLAPIGDVITRCMYVICNKNAYQSYSGENYIEYEELTNEDQLKNGMIYNFNNINGVYTSQNTTNTGKVFYSNISNIRTTYNNFTTWLEQGNNFVYYYSNDGVSFYIFNDSTSVGNANLTNSSLLTFDFQLDGYNNGLKNNYSFLTIKNMNTFGAMDNVFEYSVNELENSQIFNWTENTAIYTGVKAMTTQLEITGNVIPILITYWFLLTVIYVIIDIILKLFTVLTHMIGSKQA